MSGGIQAIPISGKATSTTGLGARASARRLVTERGSGAAESGVSARGTSLVPLGRAMGGGGAEGGSGRSRTARRSAFKASRMSPNAVPLPSARVLASGRCTSSNQGILRTLRSSAAETNCNAIPSSSTMKEAAVMRSLVARGPAHRKRTRILLSANTCRVPRRNAAAASPVSSEQISTTAKLSVSLGVAATAPRSDHTAPAATARTRHLAPLDPVRTRRRTRCTLPQGP